MPTEQKKNADDGWRMTPAMQRQKENLDKMSVEELMALLGGLVRNLSGRLKSTKQPRIMRVITGKRPL